MLDAAWVLVAFSSRTTFRDFRLGEVPRIPYFQALGGISRIAPILTG
jgi:hypothetical protein